MKYLLEVQTKSMPGRKEYVCEILDKNKARSVTFGNRFVLSDKSNALKFDSFEKAESYLMINNAYDLVTIVEECDGN